MSMRNICSLLALFAFGISSGCGKADRIDRVNSPESGLFVTVETRYGRGAVSPDFTRIYAHLEGSGQSDKKLLLDGEYLQGTKVVWLKPSEVTLCVPEGYTESFRNYVTLRAGGISQTIHTHFVEHCQP
jgi:hypothetical protein